MALRDYHPMAELFPRMDEKARADLREDIKANGLLEPIWLDKAGPGGKIIDGRSRYEACLEAGVEPVFRVWEGRSMLAFVLSLNLHRRHLTESQRALVAARAKHVVVEQRREMAAKGERGGRPKIINREDIAAALKVAPRSVSKAIEVIRSGVPALQKMVEDGQVAVDPAQMIASQCTRAQQERLVKQGAEAVRNEAARLRRLSEAGRERERRERSFERPSKEVKTIVSKPPSAPPMPPPVPIHTEPPTVHAIETEDGRGLPITGIRRIIGGVHKVVFPAVKVAGILKSIGFTFFLLPEQDLVVEIRDADGWRVKCPAKVVSHDADNLVVKTAEQLQFIEPEGKQGQKVRSRA